MSPTLGLIAGAGRLPVLVARGARAAGWRVVAVALEDIADPSLAFEVDGLAWLRLGQVEALFAHFREQAVSEVTLAGKVDPRHFEATLDLDVRGRSLLSSLADHRDDSLLGLVARSIEAEGWTIRPQSAWVESARIASGVLCGRRPDPAEWSDALLGWEAAGLVGSAGIGQTVVARAGRVVAVEAAEGTDETIERGGGLAGPGSVVVKRSRPQQDLRFDLPAVGPRTLEVMVKARARLLVLDAERTLMLDRDDVLARAGTCGISIVGVPSAGPSALDLG